MSRRLFKAVRSGLRLRFVCRAVFYFRFVNEHHRNVVAYRINASALDAFQSAAIGFQLNFRFAGGAREYFQQILTDCHGINLTLRFRRLTQEPWKEALGRAKLIIKIVWGGQ